MAELEAFLGLWVMSHDLDLRINEFDYSTRSIQRADPISNERIMVREG